MLSGTTCSAVAMLGSAVLRMVVSSDSMKNATATSHGKMRFADSVRAGCGISGSLVAFDDVKAEAGLDDVADLVDTQLERRVAEGLVHLVARELPEAPEPVLRRRVVGILRDERGEVLPRFRLRVDLR